MELVEMFLAVKLIKRDVFSNLEARLANAVLLDSQDMDSLYPSLNFKGDYQ